MAHSRITPWADRGHARRPHGRALVWLLLLIALAAAGAWWYLAPESLPGIVRTFAPPSPNANPVLYKWKDAKGRWNVTDAPPPDRPYEVLKYNPNANVVPNVKPLPSQTP